MDSGYEIGARWASCEQRSRETRGARAHLATSPIALVSFCVQIVEQKKDCLQSKRLCKVEDRFRIKYLLKVLSSGLR